MQTLRKLMIGTLATVGAMTCLAGAIMFVKNHVDVSFGEPDSRPTDVWQNAPIAAIPLGLIPERPGGGESFGTGRFSDDPPGVARVANEAVELPPTAPQEAGENDAVIDDLLCDASPDEREIWRAELSQRTPDEVREILSLRSRFAPPNVLPATNELPPVSKEAPAPRPFVDSKTAPAHDSSADALGLIESAIDATHSVEQIVLNNIANANAAIANELAELRRLQEQLKKLRQVHAELSETSRAP